MNGRVRKLVVVGDRAVGKTSLLVVFARGEFPTEYVPTVFDRHIIDMDVKGEPIKLELWDTIAQCEYYEARQLPLTYTDADVFLICFSIDNPDSLDNVVEKWVPEIKHFGAGKVPRFLVGCKTDLTRDPRTLWELARYQQTPVTTEQGRDMAKAIGAEYFECSAKMGEGVRELFARVTERMVEERVASFKHKSTNYGRPWYRGGGCIVV